MSGVSDRGSYEDDGSGGMRESGLMIHNIVIRLLSR